MGVFISCETWQGGVVKSSGRTGEMENFDDCQRSGNTETYPVGQNMRIEGV